MEAEVAQSRWVSVTHASMTARIGSEEAGAGGAVWQWLKPEVVSKKAAPGGGGGTTRAQELDAWRSTRRADAGVKGTPPSVRMAHTASALGTSGSEVLVFGGLSDTHRTLRDAFLLNTKTWEWTSVEPASEQCPAARAYHTASVISGNRVVMIGGESMEVVARYYHANRTVDLELNAVDVFDLTTKTWTSVATTVSPRKQPDSRAAEATPQADDFPQRRSGHAAVVLKGDRILISGGTNKTMVQDRCFWVLHTSTDPKKPWRWEAIDVGTQYPEPRFGHTLVSVNDTSVLLFGGKDYKYTFDDVRLISPDFKEMDFLEPAADSFPVPSLFGHSAQQVGSQMVVIGGKAFNSSSTEIYVFDLHHRTWKRQATSANPENYLPRYYHACCVFGGNKILMFGGYDLDWGCQNDMAILETGIVTSGLVTDLSRLLKQGTLSDMTIRVRSSSPAQDHQIAAHRALVAARCPSLFELASSGPHDERGCVVDVEGDPEAWTHFVHFLYTGLFADRSGDDAAFAEECGRSQVKKSLTTDDTEVVAQLLDINARHPVVGLADLLVESKGGAPRRVLPEREVIHSETLPPLVNALHDMLKQERQQKQQKAKLQDITLKLQQNGGDAPARSAHRFMLAARSEYFRAMLRFDGHESNEEVRLLELSENVSPQALDVILAFLYTDRVDVGHLEVDEALELVGVANEYLLGELKLFVERFVISSKAVDEENVFFVLDTSEHFDAHELRYHCVGLLAQSTNTSAEFNQQLAALPPHLQAAIRERQD